MIPQKPDMDAPRTRLCPFAGCNRRIQSTRFACAAHWYGLNQEQQCRIYALYSQYMAGEITGATLRLGQQEVIAEIEGGK